MLSFTGTFLDSSSLWRCSSSYHCSLRHTLWAESPFVSLGVAAPSPRKLCQGEGAATCRLPFLFLIKVEKRWLFLNYLLHQSFEVTTAQTSGLVNLVFSHQTGSFECEHLFIDKPMVQTEPAKANSQLLGLGSKLHPSNM